MDRIPLARRWNEVFGGPGSGALASPSALAAALHETKAANARLVSEFRAMSDTSAETEKRCLAVLAQHHKAHAAERERDAQRHAEEIARLRDIHASKLRALAAQAPEAIADAYDAAAYDAAQAAGRAYTHASAIQTGRARQQLG